MNNGQLVFDNSSSMQMGLRPTLWHLRLSNVLVFETEANLTAFRDRMRQRNRALPRCVGVWRKNGASCSSMNSRYRAAQFFGCKERPMDTVAAAALRLPPPTTSTHTQVCQGRCA